MTIQQNFPGIMPSLNLNFAKSKRLDPRVTLVRQTGATVVNELGYVEEVGNSVPRFQHAYDSSTGVIKSLGLLIEEQRTNLLLFSNDLSNSNWGGYCGNKNNFSYNTTDVISPDGKNTATKIVTGPTLGCTGSIPGRGLIFNQNLDITTLTDTYTISLYVRGSVGGEVLFFGLTDSYQSNYTLTTEWQRITFTGINDRTDYQLGRIFQFGTNNLNATYYVWGPQAELGSFETSYIPAGAGQAQRAEDSVYIDGRIGDNFSWYNPREGSILWTGNVYGTEKQAVCPYKISNLDNLRGIGPQFDTRSLNNTAVLMARAVSSNIPEKNAPFGTIPSSDTIKIAGAYEEGVGISAAFDGSPPASSGGDSQTDIVSGDEYYLDIGGSRSLSSSNNKFTGVCEQLVYYPRRVTDLQLQSISK